MKAKVLFPVDPAFTRQWEGKNACPVMVQGDDGNKYEIFAVEGRPAWTLAKDAECEIEIKSPAADGKPGKAKLAGGNYRSGGGYRREPLTPEQQAAEAKRLAPLAVAIYRHVDELFHKQANNLHCKPEPGNVMSMALSIFIQISDR